MTFGPDIHVFPGGRVDAADGVPDALSAAGLTPEDAAANLGLDPGRGDVLTPELALAHHVAAVRETSEETGIRIDAKNLIGLSRWVTPISLARRFDVRFFAAVVPPGTEIDGESAEVAEAAWMAPREALEAAAAGRIALWQPTFVTLQQLDGLSDADAIRAAFAPGRGTGQPAIQPVGPGLARVDAPWAAGVPRRHAMGWLVGEREVVVVNPADPTGVTMDAIRRFAASEGARIGGVVITGLAPEQHAGVEMFAHGLGLPVAAPAGGVAWAPYHVEALEVGAALPFGDPGLTLEAILAVA
jgi:8-oxo-dGTP pyrophosphatase MutT (NUDIX family)